MSQFVQVMLASSGNTPPLEGGYTELQKIASKRRNQTEPEKFETLFLLASLNIPVENPDEYIPKINRLNKGNKWQ